MSHSKLADTKINLATTLLAPYASYLPAEHLGFSGVLAVVTAGLWIGSRQRLIFREELLVEARAVRELVTVVAWTGMRGIVSLAAAMAIPLTMLNGNHFPQRDLILFLTFAVIFATLVGQGLTLPFLIRWLGVEKRAEAEVGTYTQEVPILKRSV